MENFAQFIGRFHPVWVHLPIGILLLLALLEVVGLLVRGRARSPDLEARLRTTILSVFVVATAVAAALGLALSGAGEYNADLLARHQLLGFATAFSAVVLFLVRRLAWLYCVVLMSTLGLLTVAAHKGGQITHGSDYLTAYMPPALARMLGVTIKIAPPKPPVVTFGQAEAFANVVQPILQDKCVACHGPTKTNGELRLDSWEALAKGGKHGPVLKPGNLADSSLFHRMELPIEEKQHMPPRGKPQPSDDDLKVLEWWIEAGAPRANRIAAMDLPLELREILETRLGGATTRIVPDRATMLTQATRLASELGILIRPLSPDGPWLEVNARIAGSAFGNRKLEKLEPIAPAIQWLDLGATSVTDSGLVAVQSMPALVRLHLDQLPVSDAGLVHLSHSTRLGYLNLRGTKVTDQGLDSLRHLSELRTLYVWQTAVTPAAVQALGESVTDRRKIDRWKAERAQIDRAIAAEKFDGNTGEELHESSQGDAHPPTPPTPAPVAKLP